MSRFMLLARAAPELQSPATPARAVAANEGRGALAAAPAARRVPESRRARPERTALWFWAEPSWPDAP